jgi:hypothetical protein
MQVRATVVAIATLTLFPMVSALASQGPGASPGTATPFEQGLFFAAVLAAACIGLALKLRHR